MRLKFRQAGVKAMGAILGPVWASLRRRRRGGRAWLCSERDLPVTRPSLALFALLVFVAPLARAGAAACWFENGVVVVPAEVMGVSGDFILDTATPHTLLAETQAQSAGCAETALTGEGRLAGVSVEGQAVAVADLALRTGALPTPIAGGIGADLLKGFVLDVS